MKTPEDLAVLRPKNDELESRKEMWPVIAARRPVVAARCLLEEGLRLDGKLVRLHELE